MDDQEKYILTSGNCGDGKIINQPLNQPHGKAFLTCLTLWNAKNGKPLKKLQVMDSDVGLGHQNVSDISPNGRWVIAGDVAGYAILLDLKKKKRINLGWLNFGHIICDKKEENCHSKEKNWNKPPKDFKNYSRYMHKIQPRGFVDQVQALKFIDIKGHFLRFNWQVPQYAILYSVHNSRPSEPVKYIKMPHVKEKNMPVVFDLTAEATFDTAPKAKLLVVAQQNNTGLNVYKFDEKTQTLKLKKVLTWEKNHINTPQDLKPKHQHQNSQD